MDDYDTVNMIALYPACLHYSFYTMGYRLHRRYGLPYSLGP